MCITTDANVTLVIVPLMKAPWWVGPRKVVPCSDLQAVEWTVARSLEVVTASRPYVGGSAVAAVGGHMGCTFELGAAVVESTRGAPYLKTTYYSLMDSVVDVSVAAEAVEKPSVENTKQLTL